MKLSQAFETALRTRDARTAGRCVEQLRALGYDYARTEAYAQKLCPGVDFDALMYEADTMEAS